MLRDRLIYGSIFIAALIGLVWADESIDERFGVQTALLFPAVLIVGLLASYELTVMVRSSGGFPMSRIMTMLAVAAGMTVSSFTRADLGGVSGVAVACTTAGAVLLVSMAYYARNRSAEGVVAASSATVFAFVYIGLLGGFFVVLAKEYTGWLVLGVLLTTKSCDIGAYFTGRAIGRTTLIEWLSPKKTWEGLVGGVVTSAVIGAALVASAPSGIAPLAVWEGALLGLVFGLVGQVGDLAASLMKRDMGRKDSANTLPGFGGVLDVADSPLLIGPVAYWLLTALAG